MNGRIWLAFATTCFALGAGIDKLDGGSDNDSCTNGETLKSC